MAWRTSTTSRRRTLPRPQQPATKTPWTIPLAAGPVAAWVDRTVAVLITATAVTAFVVLIRLRPDRKGYDTHTQLGMDPCGFPRHGLGQAVDKVQPEADAVGLRRDERLADMRTDDRGPALAAVEHSHLGMAVGVVDDHCRTAARRTL